eukprot:TRINITY_DN1719_c0_g1_i2.p1 TRINITY_DN1719_c0_g1~~TRINITY_DN1719_c0_g1_i2.p1  ORF type:complete len:247 (-),score=65.74 TRINITY_DN1719_c0_g1_i2:164-904(-)
MEPVNAGNNLALQPCTSPLQLCDLLTLIFDFSDSDSLDSLARVCRVFRSAIASQPCLEARMWKGRFLRLSGSYKKLKESQGSLMLDKEDLLASALDYSTAAVAKLQPDAAPVYNTPVPLKRVMKSLPGCSVNLKQKRIEELKEIRRELRKKKARNLPANTQLVQRIPEEEIYARLNEENASVFSVATNVLDYSLHSFKQRMKARRSDEFFGEILITRLEEYDKKIYGIARDRLIDRPMSRYGLLCV